MEPTLTPIAPRFYLVLGTVGLSLLASCNVITGADDIRIAENAARPPTSASSGQGAGSPDDVGSNGNGSADASATSGGATSSGVGGDPMTNSTAGSGSSTASSSTTGGGPPPIPPAPVGDAANGVAISDVKLYQSIEVPLSQQSDIPIVADKAAVVRVFYQLDGSYDGKAVTARFSSGAYYAEKSQVLSGQSSQASLASTVNIEVPAHMITVGGSYRVDLVQPNGNGMNSKAGFPQGTQQVPLGAKSSGDKLRVVLVPVNNYGTLPDTSPAQVSKYASLLRGQYPIPDVEVTVRSQPYTFNGDLTDYYGWSDLLSEISDLREQDGPSPQVYYYGIHGETNTNLLGLGWVTDASDSWSRAAIGVGTSGGDSAQTAVHEIGHNHGRHHSPCGVDGDPNYPHPDASIGVWGYNAASAKLLNPNDYVDFMSYCDPQWVSDHTYKALFKRLQSVNGAKLMLPSPLAGRTWDRVRILDGQATWLSPIKLQIPPSSAPEVVTVTTNAGTSTLEGHYYGYNHIDGGVLFVLRPANIIVKDWMNTFQFKADGKSFTLAR